MVKHGKNMPVLGTAGYYRMTFPAEMARQLEMKEGQEIELHYDPKKKEFKGKIVPNKKK